MDLSAVKSCFFLNSVVGFASRFMARARFPVFSFLGASSLVFSGCSLGLFSDGTDNALLQQKPYRPGNTLCSNIDIRSSEVSVPQFRELLACLNSNGSIKEIQNLTDKMSDEDLLPIVRVGNEQFFKNPVYLFRFQKTFEQWVADGLLEQDLDQIGSLIRNDRWVRSALSLMGKADPKFYQALKLVAQEIDPERLSRTFEALVSLVESPAFKSLQSQLLQPGVQPLSIQDIARAIFSYIQTQRAPGRVDVDRRLLKALADGSLFQVLEDFSLSLSPAGDLRETVARFAALSNQVSARTSRMLGFGRKDAELFRELMFLVNGMHAPISCLKGSVTVPDGMEFILRELSNKSTRAADQFLRRDNLLDLGLLNSFCAYPEALSKHYGSLKTLASTDTLFTAVEFTKSFYRNGSGELLVDVLGGEGTGAGIHSSLMSPLEEILPVLSELTSRGAMEDLLLLLASIRPQDQVRWQQFFSFLVQQRQELGGLSVYDVFYDTISRADSDSIADLLDGFHGFMAQKGDIFAPALRSLRRSLLMNNVHPIMDIFVGLLSNPSQNQDFFEAVFRTARSYPAEFQAAIRLVGEMTQQGDGRLKDVIFATVRVFSKFAAQGQSAGVVEAREVPAFDAVALRAHSWSKRDLVTVVPQLLPEWKGCANLSPSIRLDQYDSAGFEEEFNNYLACINSDNQHLELVDNVFKYLKGQKTSSGQPLLFRLIDSIKEFELSSRSIDQLMKRFFDLYDEGTLFRAVDALPWWFNHQSFGVASSGSATLVSPLIDLVGQFVRKASDSLLRVEKFGGQVVRGDSLPGALAFAREISDQRISATPYTDSEVFPIKAFTQPLWQYECVHRSSDVSQRAAELVQDYRKAVTGWELDSSGKPRYSWSKKKLKKELAPLAAKLADPSQGPLGTRLLDFMKMSSLQPGERPSQGRLHSWNELKDWLVERSNDWQVIPYFYPGDENPRLKVVSSLDLFELLVVNADFNVILPENFALKFLGLVAQAWGDEPRHLWPADIQAKYSRRGRPQTLREAFDEIKGTQKLAETFIGFPDLPDCPNGKRGQRGFSLVPLDIRARIFNMSQLIGVIERNLPDANTSYRGGMKIFRNLLYQMWSSTPSGSRDNCDGWKNNLSVAPKLAQLGAFRQLSRAVRLTQLPENQAERGGDVLLDSVVEGVVTVSSQSSSSLAVNALFRNDPGNHFFLSVIDSAHDLLSRESGQNEIRESLLYGIGTMRAPLLAEGLVANAALLFSQNRNELLQVIPVAGDLLASSDVSSLIRGLSTWKPASQDSLENRQNFDELLNDALRASIDGKALSVDAIKLLAVLSSAEAKISWDEFRRRRRLLEASPAYAALDLPRMTDRFLDFLSEKDSATAEAARELRQYLAARLSTGDVHEYLLLMERDPEGVRRLLAAIGNSATSGDLKELIKTARRAFPDPR